MDQPTEEIIRANVAELRLSPINYRTKLGPPEKFKQLCESVRTHGVLQPIGVRRVKGSKGLEVLFGNRRFAAAQKEGLETILAVVRDIPDADVLELQVIENAEREDPSPLEEARAYERLVKDHGRTVQQIADRIKRTPTYVAQRLRLLTLAKPVLEALDAEKITLSIATLIARVPDAKLQAEALDAIEEGGGYDGTPMKADAARKLLEEQYLLRLDQAPFDVTDAALVPKAGACTACPKRTGQQRELFPDVKSPDLCTDPPCHRTKVDALWKLRVKEAAKGGTQVVDGKEGHDAVTNVYSGKFVRLDHEEWAHSTGQKKKTVRELVAKDKPPVFLARDNDTGEIAEVIRRSDFEKATNKGQKATPAAASGGADSYAARQRREDAKRKLTRKAVNLAVAAAVAKAGKLAPLAVLELVVRAFAARVWNETQKAILEGRGITVKGNAETAIVKLAKTCAEVPGDILGLGLELALRSGAPVHGAMNESVASGWREGLKLAGVDFAKLQKTVADEAKAAKKAKGKGAKAKASGVADGEFEDPGVDDGDGAVSRIAKRFAKDGAKRKPAKKKGGRK